MKKTYKLKLCGVCSAALLSLSGCATLTDGLQQVNDALGQINGRSAGTTSARAGKSIPNKSTATYSLENMKLSESPRGTLGYIDLELSGEAYNKTNTNIRVTVSMPIYDKQGFYSHPMNVEIFIPAKEKTKINGKGSMKEGGRVDTGKIKFVLEKF